jgi:hypothetical protein
VQRREYNANLLDKPLSQPHKEYRRRPKTAENKIGTITYCGNEVRKITKLFKNTQLRIAFLTHNTIKNILKHHNQT